MAFTWAAVRRGAGQGLARVQRVLGYLGNCCQALATTGSVSPLPGGLAAGRLRGLGLGGHHGGGGLGAALGNDLALLQRQHAALELRRRCAGPGAGRSSTGASSML